MCAARRHHDGCGEIAAQPWLDRAEGAGDDERGGRTRAENVERGPDSELKSARPQVEATHSGLGQTAR